jgi:hypothetical protein
VTAVLASNRQSCCYRNVAILNLRSNVHYSKRVSALSGKESLLLPGISDLSNGSVSADFASLSKCVWRLDTAVVTRIEVE